MCVCILCAWPEFCVCVCVCAGAGAGARAYASIIQCMSIRFNMSRHNCEFGRGDLGVYGLDTGHEPNPVFGQPPTGSFIGRFTVTSHAESRGRLRRLVGRREKLAAIYLVFTLYSSANKQ